MELKRLYKQTMIESIKNSGMWLKEAKILEKNGSKGHSQALLIFAVEELGKAVLCWYTVIGLIPYNHPLVDYRAKMKQKKKGIFGNHPLKFATTLVLELELWSPGKLPADVTNAEIMGPFTDTMATVAEVIGRVGSIVARSRTRMMYVDIDVDDGEPKVHSPMMIDSESIKKDLEFFERTLKQFKKIVRTRLLSQEIVDWIQTTGKAMVKKQKDYPEDPEWVRYNQRQTN